MSANQHVKCSSNEIQCIFDARYKMALGNWKCCIERLQRAIEHGIMIIEMSEH